MKAIILAAGKGTRLYPLTFTTPKPMVPVANRPLIAYAIEMARNAGIDEIGVIVSSMDSPLVERLGDGSEHNVNVTYIIQDEQLGLAHAASMAKDFTGNDSFAMFLGDNIFQDKMGDLLRNFESSDAEATIALGEVPDPERFGVADVEDGRIKRLVEKDPNPPSNLAIAGVYLFRPSIYEAIEKIEPSARGEYEITDAIQQLVTEGKNVEGYTVQGWWMDAGKPGPIIEVNQLVMSALPEKPIPDSVQIDDQSKISARVDIGENVHIQNSVVRGPVVLGDGVKLVNAYIGPYTSLGAGTVVENSEIESSIIMRGAVIRNVPGRLDSSLIGEEATVEMGVNGTTPRGQRLVIADKSYVKLG